LPEGFLTGRGLFETMHCVHGKVFLLEDHLARLAKSCPVVALKSPPAAKLKKAVKSVIRKNHLNHAVIRLNVFNQQGSAGIFVFARKLPKRARRGFSVILLDREKTGVSALSTVKSLNHYFYSRLTRLAKELGFDEALFLNSRSEVAEGSRTNVFVVKKGQILTPPLTCGCLPGITRNMAIGLARNSHIPVFERRILPKELFTSDEIFLTNALVGIMPVFRLNKRLVSKGRVGDVTKIIAAAYEKEVVQACGLG